MNHRAIVALVLAGAFAVPIAAGAATTERPHPKKVHNNGINSSHPGSPGYTNSSPLGSAEKADIRAKKKAAKRASKPKQ
jgi:hypothetical protein